MQSHLTSIRRQPSLTQGSSGAPVVVVPLSGSDRPCLLDAADFHRVVDLVGTDQWRLSNGTVVATRQGIGIARMIMGATELDRVSYLDGDRHNLLRSNLQLLPIKRWMKARKLVLVDQSMLVVPVGR
jgi:hypothetical protein